MPEYLPIPPLTDPDVLREVERLMQAHAETARIKQVAEESDPYGIQEDYGIVDENEQEAWDTLVDFVEGSDLTYTVHDPRGPFDEELED